MLKSLFGTKKEKTSFEKFEEREKERIDKEQKDEKEREKKEKERIDKEQKDEPPWEHVKISLNNGYNVLVPCMIRRVRVDSKRFDFTGKHCIVVVN